MITTELVNDHGAVITLFKGTDVKELLHYAGNNLGWFSANNPDGLMCFWGQVGDRTFHITVEGKEWIIGWSNFDMPKAEFEKILLNAIDGETELKDGEITVEWEKPI